MYFFARDLLSHGAHAAFALPLRRVANGRDRLVHSFDRKLAVKATSVEAILNNPVSEANNARKWHRSYN